MRMLILLIQHKLHRKVQVIKKELYAKITNVHVFVLPKESLPINNQCLRMIGTELTALQLLDL